MMRKNFILVAILFCSIVSSQVVICANINTYHDSELLKIFANTKAVFLSNVAIPDLNYAAPVISPALSQTINLFLPVNTVSVIAGGIAQVNSSSSDNTFI